VYSPSTMRTGTAVATPIQRDETFWRAAYEEHSSAVLAFLLRRLGRRDEAEDLLQEAFVRAIRVDTFDGENLRGYMLSIARNLLINRMRRPRLVVPVVAAEDEQPFADVPSTDTSPEQEAGWNLFEERLEVALAGMKADHSKAFRMAVMEQRSYAEIAETMGWSLPRVKSNVYRARRTLLQELQDYLPGHRGAES